MKGTILHVLKYDGETTQKNKEARCINSFDTKTKGLNNKYELIADCIIKKNSQQLS